MISQTAEYALRAIIFLGRLPDVPCSTSQIAAKTETPPESLAKIMRGLARVGIVESQPGLCGGFALVRDPSDLTVLDVACAVDAFHRIPKCPLGKPAHTSGLCPLQRRIDHLMAASDKSKGATIRSLLDEPNLVCTYPCVTEPSDSWTTRV